MSELADIIFSMTLSPPFTIEEDLFSFLSRSLHLLTSDQWSSYEEDVNAHRELPSEIEGGKGADLPPPPVTSLASPHRPLASDGSLEPRRREYL